MQSVNKQLYKHRSITFGQQQSFDALKFFCARKCSLLLLLLSRGEHPHKAFLVLRCENETSHTAAAAVRSSSLLMPSRGQKIRSIILLFYFAFDCCCRDFLSLVPAHVRQLVLRTKFTRVIAPRCSKNKIGVIFEAKSKHSGSWSAFVIISGLWENEEIFQQTA
jgi:hypothetical protein